MTDTVKLYVAWNAITAGGFPVNLSLFTDSIFMYAINSIDNLKNTELNITPNPASESIELNTGFNKSTLINL